jgi:lyso-ornithine lipid O-acyltransferase
MRAARRAISLGFALTVSIFELAAIRLRGSYPLERRARWIQSTARRVLTSLHIQTRIIGDLPVGGLIVSNHLSYLDIAIYAAIVPCSMVAKVELSRWPVFGMMARSSGALFVDRSSRTSAVTVTNQVAERLRGPVPVLFFPEGTTTDGSEVKRFHSRLFTPAVEAQVPVTAAAVRYVIEDGTPESELCWVGDAALLPHLWKTLGITSFTAEAFFGPPQVYPDRRTAANATHDEIEAMRSASPVLVY